MEKITAIEARQIASSYPLKCVYNKIRNAANGGMKGVDVHLMLLSDSDIQELKNCGFTITEEYVHCPYVEKSVVIRW